MLHGRRQFPVPCCHKWMERVLVCERDKNDSEERGNGISNVVPIDLPYVANHQRPDDHEGAASRPGGEAGENRSEEDRDEKCETRRDRCDTRLSALYMYGIMYHDNPLSKAGQLRTSNACGAFDKRRDGAGPQKCAHRDADCVNAVCDRAALKIHRDRIAQARKFGHRVECPSRIENVDIEHGAEGVPHPAVHVMVINDVADELDGAECHDFLEVIECGVAGVGVRKGGDSRSTRPRDDGCYKNTDEDRTLDMVHY